MKAYDIALFLIFLMVSLNILMASEIFGDEIDIDYGSNLYAIDTTMRGAGYSPPTSDTLQKEEIGYTELAISSFGLLIRSLIAIVFITAYSTIFLDSFLNQLGLPPSISLGLTIGTWICYGIGYAQYRSRSSLQGIE